MEELILCNTNLSVTRVVVLCKTYTSRQFFILTDQKNIFDFFSLCSFDNVVIKFIKLPNRHLGFANFGIKKEIKKIFSKHDFSTLRFFHQAYGGIFNWIIYYAHKVGLKIVYHRVLRDQQYPKCRNIIMAIKHSLIYKLFFKTDIIVLDRGGGNIMPKLSKSFFLKNKVLELECNVNNIIIENVTQILMTRLNIDDSSKKIVLLTGSLIETNQVDRETYDNEIKEIIYKIGEENIICKCHPRFNDECEQERKMCHIPSFVPMEFLISRFSIFIGYNSTVLCNAAEQGCKAVSLLYCITPKSEIRRNNWKQYFVGYNVEFPTSINEIKL